MSFTHKNILGQNRRSRTSLVLGLALPAISGALVFCAGFFASALINNHSDFPEGKWLTLYVENGISVQLNIDTIQKSKTQESFTMWVREDRKEMFSSGLVTGKTVLSHITVNCDEDSVILHEQHGFDSALDKLMSSEKEIRFTSIEEVVVGVLHFSICSQHESDKKLKSDLKDPVSSITKFTPV